jgi:hypothetical protein
MWEKADQGGSAAESLVQLRVDRLVRDIEVELGLQEMDVSHSTDMLHASDAG